MLSRRNILKGIALSPFVLNSLRSENKVFSRYLIPNYTQILNNNSNKIVPNSLKRGSKVAIIAPASPAGVREMTPMLRILKSLGVEVEIGDSVSHRDKSKMYLSLSDEQRAVELMHYFSRKDIDGIICARGGYGVMRILDKLDYSIIRNNPKILIGFSDITALLIALNLKSDLVCYHGPVASSSMNDFTKQFFFQSLFSEFQNGNIEYQNSKMEIISNGFAIGKLVGGNLTMVVSTLGTPFEIQTTGCIIFLEETSEEPYKIDRMLTQLKLSGKLNSAAGIVLGNFEYLNSKRAFYPGRSFSTMQVLNDRLGDLNIPVLFGLPFGHSRNNMTLPLGIMAKIDTSTKTFAIIEGTTC